MNTPITDAAVMRAGNCFESGPVVHAWKVRMLETDRAALMDRLEKSQALLAKLYDESGQGTTIWHKFPQVNSDNINALAAARANFPTP